MIDIRSINIFVNHDVCRVAFKILEDNHLKNLWLEVNAKYKAYIVLDRVDGIVIGLLNYAMRNGHDIRSELPISENLFYNLNEIIIPALAEANTKHYKTQIICPVTEKRTEGQCVGTGISCGVDSLYALAKAQRSLLPGYKVTHLAFNNVGQHGPNDTASQRFKERIKVTRQFAEDYGFELVECDSNYHILFPQNHLYSHTYANLFPVVTLGNLFRIYYYASSGIKYNEIDFSKEDPGYIEPLLLPMLSTPSLAIYSGGANTSRMDKIRILSDYAPAHDYLQVCVSDSVNCGECEKCTRTLAELESLNVIDCFSNVFDLHKYYDNHDSQMEKVYYQYLRGHHDYKDIYAHLRNKIKLGTKLKVRGKILIENLIVALYPLKKMLLPNIHVYKQR